MDFESPDPSTETERIAMAIASLILWVLTASGGAYLLAKWVGGGGHRESTASKLPPAAVFGHFALAALGLVLWIIYVVTDNHPIGWVGLALLAPVAVLGFVMLARWLPTRRSVSAGGRPSSNEELPERSFPVPVVAAHGVLAVATIVVALLALWEIAG
jgi:manganese efflux pump family protein